MGTVTYRWSKMPEHREWMLENAGNRTIAEVRRAFEERFGTPISKGQVSLFRAEYDLQRRRGNRAAHRKNAVPVGTEKESKGYVWVKVAELPSKPQLKDNWVPKQKAVWERTRGLKLPKGFNVLFCDGDARNFDPANLKAVPRKLMGVMNGSGGWSDRATLEACAARAMLKCSMMDVRRRPRKCVVCGAEFTPDAMNSLGQTGKGQITCRACLDAGRTSYGLRDYGEAACEQCGAVFRRDSSAARFCPECRPRKRKK